MLISLASDSSEPLKYCNPQWISTAWAGGWTCRGRGGWRPARFQAGASPGLFFIFIFKNKTISKIYAGLEKLRNWGPVAHPRGDRDLYIRSVGDKDLYVRKNNYMLTGGAGPPFKGRQGTGWWGCSVVLLWRAETGVVTSAAPIHPSIRGRYCCVASWSFLLRGRGQQSRRWDFLVTYDRWRRDESALHYTQAAVIIIMEKNGLWLVVWSQPARGLYLGVSER